MNKNNNSNKGLATFILILFLVIIIVFQWIGIILTFIVGLITFFIEKYKINKMTAIKTDHNDAKKIILLDKKQFYNALGLFYIDIYDYLFKPQIMMRGQTYFISGKAKKYKCVNNKYTCAIQGTEKYNVSITFDKEDSNKIIDARCTCPYYKEDKTYCKHIYALLLGIKCRENVDLLKCITNQYIDSITQIIDNTDNYIKNHKDKVTKLQYNECYDYIENIANCLNKIKEIYNKASCEFAFYYCVQECVRLTKKIDKELPKLVSPFYSKNEIIKTAKIFQSIKLKDISISLLDNSSNTSPKKSTYIDKALDDYGLEEWEKDLVKSGEYDSWNFGEEELEDDDYYSDDDI